MIEKKEFAATVFDPKNEIMVKYVAYLAISDSVKLFRKPLIALLKVDETFTTVFPEYANSADVFFPGLTTALPHNIQINNQTIQ